MFQKFHVTFLAFACADVLEDFPHAANAFPAGDTLAAGLFLQKGQKILSDIDHTRAVVHDDHTAGTHHGADFVKSVEIHLQIQKALGNTAAGRTAGLHGFELASFGDAAAHAVDDFPQRHRGEQRLIRPARRGASLRTSSRR
jgi:hypothetical protein